MVTNTKIRVLISDDHSIVRSGIRALLELEEDIEVIGEASNGKEAVEMTSELQPDVVLMDIAMPLIDGLEATRRITKANPKAKVLMLTQYDNKEYALSSIKAGASGYVPKKAGPVELVAAIRSVNQGDAFLHPSMAKWMVKDYLQRADEDPYDSLTEREREVLRYVAEGRANREIATLLCISVKTVLGHRERIMSKLDVHSRTDLIKYAIRKGLIAMDS
ncbi:MAG: response regulator transcription factor [Chloroflexi bacterium]|nr:response regulator transcription factor [Chloroflexota bacterium]